MQLEGNHRIVIDNIGILRNAPLDKSSRSIRDDLPLAVLRETVDCEWRFEWLSPINDDHVQLKHLSHSASFYFKNLHAHLIFIIYPRAELERAKLIVEREKGYIKFAD